MRKFGEKKIQKQFLATQLLYIFYIFVVLQFHVICFINLSFHYFIDVHTYLFIYEFVY